MQHVSSQHKCLSPLLALMVCSSILYNTTAKANNINPSPGPVLAYFVGYHNYYGGNYRPGFMYYGPRYSKDGRYWTGWRYAGYGCQKSCQLDRFGRAIRCKKRC